LRRSVHVPALHAFPTRRSSDLSGPCAYDLDERVHFQEGMKGKTRLREMIQGFFGPFIRFVKEHKIDVVLMMGNYPALIDLMLLRSEEHTSELQSRFDLVCRLLL